jgi:hypothetical protein
MDMKPEGMIQRCKHIEKYNSTDHLYRFHINPSGSDAISASHKRHDYANTTRNTLTSRALSKKTEMLQHTRLGCLLPITHCCKKDRSTWQSQINQVIKNIHTSGSSKCITYMRTRFSEEAEVLIPSIDRLAGS